MYGSFCRAIYSTSGGIDDEKDARLKAGATNLPGQAFFSRRATQIRMTEPTKATTTELEHFHKSCSVFGVKKEAFAVGSGNGSEGSLGGEKQFAFRAGSLAAEDFFDLAPHIFDGIEVW
jgi:hypothetical protein